MRIGITGASGFIGSHLLQALERLPDVTVTALQRHDKNAPDSDTLKQFVKNKDLIYHLSGINRGTDEEILRVNILGTFNLVEAIKTHSSARMVFASSAQVYKPGKLKTPVRETDATVPVSLYGLSKKTAEDLLRLSGIDYVALRLSNTYGPGCRPYYNSVVATLCEQATLHEPLTINGDGRQGRDFIYIDDVVQAFILAGTMPQKATQPVFNVSSNRITSLRQVVGKIKQEYTRLAVTYRTEVKSEGVSCCCNNTRFRKLYGWKPKTSLTEGIKQTLCWLEERQQS